jgi:acyl dehydratase
VLDDGLREVGAIAMTRLLYAEDLLVGSTHDLGEHQVTLEEILSFAELWDPQPFHVDAEAAANGYFGGLIASGLHTLGVFQRLAVLNAYRHWAIIAGLRIHDVSLPAPVRPGAVLAGRIVIDEMRYVGSDRALMTKRGQLHLRSTLVMEAIFEAYIRRRPLA